MTDTTVGICQQYRDIYRKRFPFWQSYRTAMHREKDFLEGDRYIDDKGPHNKDRRLVQIKGQQIQDTVRHIVAQSTARPRSIQAKPIDNNADRRSSEIAVSLVEWETGDPWKDFDGRLEAAIVSAREQRLGCVWIDWVPDLGPYGEITFRYSSPDRIMWDECYDDPHDPLCTWLLEERRIDVDVIHAMYPGSDWIRPDADQPVDLERADKPIQQSTTLPGRAVYDDNRATLWYWWTKRDYTVKPDKRTETKPIPPDQQYMACDPENGGCGYRSMTAGDLKSQGRMTGPLPERLPNACPDCMDKAKAGEILPNEVPDLVRIDTKYEDQQVRAYTQGKRLVVMAPYCKAPNDEPLADGDWPIPEARSFPIFVITKNTEPGKPMGTSDTYDMWDQQLASDQLKTLAVQRIFEHQSYWLLPRKSVYDHAGDRYVFRDDQYNHMYYDQEDALQYGPPRVDRFDGTGLDPAFGMVNSIIDQSLTQYRGVADFGITPDNSKAIAASTVAQLNQIGEIPTAHFNRRKNRALSKFYGVLWDYIRATYTPKRLARLQIEGVDLMAGLQGDELPNFDFVISETPDFTGLEKARADAFDALMNAIGRAMQMGVDPTAMVELFADVNYLPESVVAKARRLLEQMQPQTPPGPPGQPPGMPGQGPSPDQLVAPQTAGAPGLEPSPMMG